MKKTMLAIMGSPNSGKTTTACKLALELTQRKLNVLLVFCDTFTPPAAYVLRPNTAHEVSLGKILTNTSITQESILKACVTLSSNPYLSILGYKSGETQLSFSSITEERTTDLITLTRPIADIIIFDCSTVYAADRLSSTAIAQADTVLRIVTPNPRGLAWQQSNIPILAQNQYIESKHITILGCMPANQTLDIAAQLMGGAAMAMAADETVNEQYNEYKLFEPIKTKNNSYNAAVVNLADIIVGERNAEKPKDRKKKVSIFRFKK